MCIPSPLDVHREHLCAVLAKAAKATHTCQEVILSPVPGREAALAYSVDMNLRKLQEMVKDREAWHAGISLCSGTGSPVLGLCSP